jgi:hypothetical protein
MYPSDISDKEWVILGLFVAQEKIGRPRQLFEIRLER